MPRAIGDAPATDSIFDDGRLASRPERLAGTSPPREASQWRVSLQPTLTQALPVNAVFCSVTNVQVALAMRLVSKVPGQPQANGAVATKPSAIPPAGEATDEADHREATGSAPPFAQSSLMYWLDRFAGAHHLSKRETDVLYHAASGRSMKESAAQLGISTKTVESYWFRIYAKTKTHSQLQTLAEVLRWTTSRLDPPERGSW
jgi:DNA-binding CsgD family transcriptional regulator